MIINFVKVAVSMKMKLENERDQAMQEMQRKIRSSQKEAEKKKANTGKPSCRLLFLWKPVKKKKTQFQRAFQQKFSDAEVPAVQEAFSSAQLYWERTWRVLCIWMDNKNHFKWKKSWTFLLPFVWIQKLLPLWREIKKSTVIDVLAIAQRTVC